MRVIIELCGWGQDKLKIFSVRNLNQSIRSEFIVGAVE